jgi:osmotically-inducible protein OsmY
MNSNNCLSPRSRRAVLLTALVGAFASTACAPIIVGGAMVGSVVMATDRRTSGTQVEDEGIEYKASGRISATLGDRVHVNVNSYNRMVLITGEALTEADRLNVEKIVLTVENVRQVLNEVAVMPLSSYTTRSNDVLISSKVKASLIEAPDLISNAFYVVVERGTVFIMGRVTEREASRAVQIARGVSGVNKVVRAVEIISEEELARLSPPPKPAPAQ